MFNTYTYIHIHIYIYIYIYICYLLFLFITKVLNITQNHTAIFDRLIKLWNRERLTVIFITQALAATCFHSTVKRIHQFFPEMVLTQISAKLYWVQSKWSLWGLFLFLTYIKNLHLAFKHSAFHCLSNKINFISLYKSLYSHLTQMGEYFLVSHISYSIKYHF